MTALNVLLTPRQLGGHEKALFGWLADARREFGLRPRIVTPTDELTCAAIAAGLDRDAVRPAIDRTDGSSPPAARRLAALHALRQMPPQDALLLAPGVLQADAWLLAAAVTVRRRAWVYVPMTSGLCHLR